MYDFIKRVLVDDATYYALIIVLAAVASFGLGRWSLNDAGTPSGAAIITLQEESTSESNDSIDTVEKQYVASKNGSKYYLLWCPGASRIKEENKIYFDSQTAAETAGYTPAANCPEI